MLDGDYGKHGWKKAAKEKKPFTHGDLVQVASRWLFRCVKSHAVAAPGNIMLSDEVPDAIGWSFNGKSVLIEVKVSRSDFFADADKPFRKKPERGMGLWRYYMTPRGLVKPEEVPEGWGLLEVDDAGRVYVKRKGKVFLQRNLKEEMRLMVGCLRRIQGEVGKPVWKFGIDTSVYVSSVGMLEEPGPETVVEAL